MQILLIEPDRLLAKNIVKSLKAAGHNVSHYVEPQSAVMAADGKLPDVVITELLLAGHSGAEFLYEFRSYPEWQTLPVVILSNLPPAEAKNYMDSLERLNIRHFLYKPETSLLELTEVVGQLAAVTP